VAGVESTIHDFVAAHRGEAERFLAGLVKVPSDNSPGDCAPDAQRAAQLLEAMAFAVERHIVPAAAVAANGMISCTNLVVRARAGDGRGPVIALNAHGDVVPPGLANGHRADEKLSLDDRHKATEVVMRALADHLLSAQ
jgi:acetylornithine deacetylase/succinyl-diaminopimelate desuccinylase-like protein